MDLGRQPLWPRLWETFGEDVYLAQQLREAYIEGAQGENISRADKVATCLKHFVRYSFPFNGHDRTPAYMSERTLREYFLPLKERWQQLRQIKWTETRINSIIDSLTTFLAESRQRNFQKWPVIGQ